MNASPLLSVKVNVPLFEGEGIVALNVFPLSEKDARYSFATPDATLIEELEKVRG